MITENTVGPLEKSNSFSDLETIFSQDSIIKDTFRLQKGQNPKKLKIFEKGGKHLLTITSSNDSIPKIENIRIEDERYVTKEGIGLSSNFKAIQDAYEIKKIVTTMGSVVIFPKGSNLYFTIDKDELPANLRFSSTNVEAVQIPEEAKIKYLMVSWE